MPLYRIVGVVQGSKYLGEFEAASREEAEEMALNSESASVCLCHQCSEQCEDPEIDRVHIEEVEAKPKRRKPPRRTP